MTLGEAAALLKRTRWRFIDLAAQSNLGGTVSVALAPIVLAAADAGC